MSAVYVESTVPDNHTFAVCVCVFFFLSNNVFVKCVVVTLLNIGLLLV